MQAAVNFMVADMNKEIQALQATEVVKNGKLQACEAEAEAEVEVSKAWGVQVKNRGSWNPAEGVRSCGGQWWVRPSIHHSKRECIAFYGARCTREIDNFLWGLETYSMAMGIEDDA